LILSGVVSFSFRGLTWDFSPLFFFLPFFPFQRRVNPPFFRSLLLPSPLPKAPPSPHVYGLIPCRSFSPSPLRLNLLARYFSDTFRPLPPSPSPPWFQTEEALSFFGPSCFPQVPQGSPPGYFPLNSFRSPVIRFLRRPFFFIVELFTCPSRPSDFVFPLLLQRAFQDFPPPPFFLSPTGAASPFLSAHGLFFSGLPGDIPLCCPSRSAVRGWASLFSNPPPFIPLFSPFPRSLRVVLNDYGPAGALPLVLFLSEAFRPPLLSF